MNKIVLGIAASHSPLLALEAEDWLLRSQDDIANRALNLSDGSFVAYGDLLERRGAAYIVEADMAILSAQQRQAQAALDRLADEIERAAPDVAIIIGDDHQEMFDSNGMPGVALYCGDELVMHTWLETFQDPPRWLELAIEGYAMEAPHRFPGSPEFATRLVDCLMDKGVDMAVANSVADPAKAGLGHAFGFVIKRLFRGRRIPVIPMLVNTYYPPNVVRPARCYDIGRKLREAITEVQGSARVAIIGSGGLSHFVTDAALDRSVLAALETKDAATLKALPMGALNSGSSEILCWVMAAGALESLPTAWTQYLPVYRTPAGTGIGLAFAAWRPN